MRTIYSDNSIFKIPVQIAGVLLFAAVAAFGQAPSVGLTAAPTQIVTPDGATTQMWGYTCGTVVGATCAKLNINAPAAVGTTPAGWSPVVITVPYTATTANVSTTNLTINLTNNLPTPPGATSGIPTSLVIVGQLGGGLGDVTQRTVTASPDHSNAQGVTWPIAGANPGVQPPGVVILPMQDPRVQSFGTEVQAGTTQALCWGPSCATPTPGLRPGTYLLQSGTHPSIQVPMGLIGMLVVTTPPASATAPGTAYPDGTAPVTYNAEVPMLFSEIDPVQNNAVSTAVNTAGFLETNVWSGLPGGCGNPNSGAGVYQTCYPPAVNYTPLYYLINGVAFNKANTAFSLFPTAPATGLTAGTGQVLVRLVNAGLRMHVPSIVGAQIGAARPGDGPPSGFALIAEDGNRLPGVPRIQNEVFMAAGKTYDVMMDVPAAGAAALPIFDRQLSLAGNGVGRDGGMLAYISANSAAAPSVAAVAAAANPDNYTVHAGQNLVVSDPAKGLLGNDVGIYGVQVQGTPPAGLTMNANGTFAYIGGVTTSFTYCGNGATTGAQCALVNLTLCTGTCLEAATGIVMSNITYAPPTVNALSVKINPPGILSVDKDNAGYPLTVNLATASTPLAIALTGTGCGTATVDMNGGFTASASAAGTCTFTYNAKNAQGVVSAAAATVTIIFPAATGLAVTVKDGTDKTTLITDYRWIIEEDRTFYINPNTTTNNGGTTIVPTFGTNFHTSFMPVIATGCTGPLSCESMQTIYDNGVPCIGVNNPVGCSPTAGQHINAVCDVGNGVCRPDTAGAGFAAVNPNRVHLDPTKRYYISILPGDAANPFISANLTASCANVPRKRRIQPFAATAWAALPSPRAKQRSPFTRNPPPSRRRSSRCSYSKTTSPSMASRMARAAWTCCPPTSLAWGTSRSRSLTTRAAPATLPASPRTTCSTSR